MKEDNDLWADAKCAALQVEFLTTKEELSLYTNALYYAVMWGRERLLRKTTPPIYQEKHNLQ